MRHVPKKSPHIAVPATRFRPFVSKDHRRRNPCVCLPTLERLEPRHLLIAGVDAIHESPIQDVPADVPTAPAPTVGEVCGRGGVFVSDDPPALPAASPLDLNLDGVFDSADLVAAYQANIRVVQASGASTQVSQDAHSVLFKSSDLIETLQFHAYESFLPTSGESCNDGREQQRVEYDFWHSQGQNVRETVTYAYAGEFLRSRSASQMDLQGNTRTVTVDTYTEGSESIASRSEMRYDSRGNLILELALFYDAQGDVRRSTTTAYDYGPSPVFKLTNVFNFDDQGRIVLQRTHRFDTNLNQIGLEVLKYEYAEDTSPPDGGNSKVSASSSDPQNGSERLSEVDAVLGLSDLSYLTQVRDAYLTARQLLEPYYREILRMNELQVQSDLEALLSSSEVSSSEANRLRNLDLYFRLTTDLVSVNQNDEPLDFHDRYANVVDVATGAWQPWFLNFAQKEGLTLPLPPLNVAFFQSDRSPHEIADLAGQVRQIIGSNPVRFFQELRQNGAEQVSRMLEGMRRVKSQIKLVELQAEGEARIFEWVIARDRPDLDTIGLQPIQLLASWYFFETDESGDFLLDEVSEAVFSKRANEYLKDEEVFYVIDIEHWALGGEPEVVDASLEKLRHVADMVHKYNPNLLIGFYRLLPRRDPYAAYAGPGTSRHEAWQVHNNQVAAALRDAVDIIFPSLYVVHLGNQDQTTAELWADYAEGNIQEARRISGGKPVVPFLALYYHPNGFHDSNHVLTRNLKGWQWVEPELLLYQMMRLDQLADGFVLFNDLPTDWDGFVRSAVS